jgi:hypothetical protein
MVEEREGEIDVSKLDDFGGVEVGFIGSVCTLGTEVIAGDDGVRLENTVTERKSQFKSYKLTSYNSIIRFVKGIN